MKERDYFFRETAARVRMWKGPFRAPNVHRAWRLFKEKTGLTLGSWRAERNTFDYKTAE